MKDKKIVLLATEADTTIILYHKLAEAFNIHKILIEEKAPIAKTIQRRLKKLGVATVTGQICFKLIIEPALKIISGKRIKQIIKENSFNTSPIHRSKIIKVRSVNNKTTITLLQQLNPDLIIIHGTNVLSPHLLNSVSCKFINIHAGITPKYRGVHGGYWALVNNDKQNFGVTVHFVDAGIDTGDIIAQQTISITPADNFYTYPYLQLTKGIELLIKGIKDHFEKTLITHPPRGESKLRYHPTLCQYICNWWKRKVK